MPDKPPLRPYSIDLAADLPTFCRKIRREGREVLGIFGVDGRFALPPRFGEEDKIELTEEEAKVCANATLVHNHPSGATFGDEDFEAAAVLDLRSLVVVTRQATISIDRPAGGWPRATSMIATLRAAHRDVVAKPPRITSGSGRYAELAIRMGAPLRDRLAELGVKYSYEAF